MDIKNILFKLSERDSVGNIREASDFAYNEMAKFAEVERTNNLGVIGFLKGKSDYTVMLDAHIDQIAMIVTGIDDNGFLSVAKSGGIDIRALPARSVTVYGTEKISAVFCSTPPHLASGEVEYDNISKIKLDTGLGTMTKNIVSVGNYVTFSSKPENLLGDRVTGRSFDDRSGVACLLELSERLSGKELPVNVVFALSDQEELGLRGAITAAYKVNPDEAVVIDVSFGDGIGISNEECGKLAGGPMIGISPALDSKISEKLIKIATENEISHQLEVMGEYTGTNADVISVIREGVRACTLSIPLRNMHTDVELLDLKDLYSTCDLLEKYIISGGVSNV